MKVPGAVRIDASRLALLAPYRAPFLPPPSSSPRTAAQPSATGSSRPPIAIPIPKKNRACQRTVEIVASQTPRTSRVRHWLDPDWHVMRELVRDAECGDECVRAQSVICSKLITLIFFSLCLGEKDRPFFASNFVLL